MTEFDAFKLQLEQWCLAKLQQSDSTYVSTLLRRSTEPSSDPAKVIQKVKPLLGPPRPWVSILTATLDVEQAKEQLLLAVRFLGIRIGDGPVQIAHPGAWTLYHADMWYLSAYGYLDRVDKLIAQTCRRVIADKARRDSIVTPLRNDVAELKNRVAKTRHEVAHGGGTIEALADERLWEPYLVLGGTTSNRITASYHDSVTSLQAKWHKLVSSTTDSLLRATEAFFRTLTRDAF